MRFELSSEQEMLRESVAGTIARLAPIVAVREWLEAGEGTAHARPIITDAAWFGIGVDEERGGQGGGAIELAVVAEEGGRAVLPGDFLPNVLAITVLQSTDPEPGSVKHNLLADLIAGERTAALALPSGAMAAKRSFTAVDGSVSGGVQYVLGAPDAEVLIVPVVEGSETRLFAIASDAAEVTITRLITMDTTRTWGDIDLEGAAGGLLGTVPGHLDDAVMRAAVLVAADSLGGARQALQMTADYARDRVQFGKPIGSFQAIKHGLAEMLVDVEAMYSAVYYGAWALDNSPADARRAVSIAKFFSADAYSSITERSVALHGAIGFTWEHDLHYYFKRARANAGLFGTATQHRERVAETLNLIAT